MGYFQKQGFTKEIILEREKWSQYIKARPPKIKNPRLRNTPFLWRNRRLRRASSAAFSRC